MVDHLSYSSITTYLSCPRSWAFKYIEKAPTYATPELVTGTAVHNVIEAYLGQTGVRQPLTSLWGAAWAKSIERGPVVWGADSPEQHSNDGLRLIANEQVEYGINTITPLMLEAGPAIEQKVELRVPGVPIPIIGYIDIQTADEVPGDIKTSARSWTQDRAQSETQSLFYLAALNQAGRTVPGWKFRHYVIVKTKTPQWQVFEHSHKPGEVFWLFGLIASVWKGIEAGAFPENPTGWKCSPQYCDFWSKCRGKYL